MMMTMMGIVRRANDGGNNPNRHIKWDQHSLLQLNLRTKEIDLPNRATTIKSDTRGSADLGLTMTNACNAYG